VARDLPAWLEPRITDMSHEPFVVARARMGGFAAAKALGLAGKRRIGRRAGLAGSFSRWGWGQMGIKTRPPVSYLGFVALQVIEARTDGVVRNELSDKHGGPLRHGGVYAVTKPLARAGLISAEGSGRFGKRYFITPKGLLALVKTRVIIEKEAVA